jgi:hypothetical protein
MTPGPIVMDETGVGPENYYTIMEIIYNADGTEYARDPAYPIGDSLDDLRLDLRWMLEATKLPVLE